MLLLVQLFLVAMGALLGGWACRRLGIPEVLGYLCAGVLLGPTLHPETFVDAGMIQSITYFAVVFRMFILGLDFDARRLRGRWRPALSAGMLEMGVSTIAGIGLATILGWPLLQGAILGAALGTTSTSILSKALADRNMTGREDARAAGAATLAEDLIAMTLLALLTVYATATQGGHFDASALWRSSVELIVFASLAFTAGAVLMPVWIDRLSRSHSEELLTLAAIAVLFGFAALSETLHAGRPVGAFLAGIAVGAARNAPGLSARMLPMRDLFAAAAYVGIGLILQPKFIVQMAPYALLAIPVFVALKVLATSIGLRLGGVPTLTAARAGGILGQAGTMGLVVACGPLLGDNDAIGRLVAFAFLAWVITVAMTGLRLRYLPDINEKIIRALGASDAPASSRRLPRAADAESRAQMRVAVTAAGCAVALAALAGLASQGAAVFLPDALPPIAAASGALAAFLAIPFIVIVAVAFRQAARTNVHRAALQPQRLTRGHRTGARPWTVTGSMLGLALAAAATLGMAYAASPLQANLWLSAGALAAIALHAARPAALGRFVDRCRALLDARPAPEARLQDFRGVAPFGHEVESTHVRTGTRAAWARIASLDLHGARVAAVLRPGVIEPAPATRETVLHPGDEVVLAGTAAQILGAKRHMQQLLAPLEHELPVDDRHVDAQVGQAPGARIG